MWVMFALSAVLLAGGTEGFARGAEKLGVPSRFRALLTGLSFALPTLLVSFVAGFGRYPKLAVAVLLGSLIANVGLVLSLSTLARPTQSKNPQIRLAIPLLIAGMFLAWFLARDNELSRIDGVLLLLAGIGSVVALLKLPAESSPRGQPSKALGIVLALTGLGWAIGAAFLLVRASSDADGLIPQLGIGGTAFALALLAPVLAVRGVAVGMHAAQLHDGETPISGVVIGGLITLFVGFGTLAVVNPLVVIEPVVMNIFPAAAVATLLLIAVRINDMNTRRVDGLLQLAAYLGFFAWMLKTH